MLSSELLVALGSLLLIYWLRYTCLLLRRNGQHSYSITVAGWNGMSFPAVQEELRGQEHRDDLVRLYAALQRDRHLLGCLLEHVWRYGVVNRSPEARLLLLEFASRRLWFLLVRRHWPTEARRTLAEMAAILAHLANSMGEQVAATAR